MFAALSLLQAPVLLPQHHVLVIGTAAAGRPSCCQAAGACQSLLQVCRCWVFMFMLPAFSHLFSLLQVFQGLYLVARQQYLLWQQHAELADCHKSNDFFGPSEQFSFMRMLGPSTGKPAPLNNSQLGQRVQASSLPLECKLHLAWVYLLISACTGAWQDSSHPMLPELPVVCQLTLAGVVQPFCAQTHAQIAACTRS